MYYHADLQSAHEDPRGATEEIVTDIAIMNPNPTDIQLPVTSSVVIGVNEIMPLKGEHEEHGAGAEGAGGKNIYIDKSNNKAM